VKEKVRSYEEMGEIMKEWIRTMNAGAKGILILLSMGRGEV